MNTLIVFGTKYGCAQKCAEILSGKLPGKVELCNIRSCKAIDLSQYDRIIIGGSIYAGRIQKEITEFCTNNLSALKSKKLGLYACGLRDGEMGESELDAAFPKELINSAVSKEYFGGEVILSKMNFIDKMIVKAVAKVDKDMINIKEGNIDKLAKAMSNA